MTLTENQRDIIDSCRVAIVVTNGDDDYPHTTATWFERDGDEIRMSIAERGVKARNIRREPHGTVFFIDPATSLRSVELRCDLELRADPGMSDATRIGGRMGDDLTQYVEEDEGRLTVICHIRHVTEFDVA